MLYPASKSHSNKVISILEQKVEELENAKIGFVSCISHELRNPLTYIISAANNIKSNASEDNSVSNINESAVKLLRIIDDIIVVSKSEAAMLHLEKERIDLRFLVDKVLRLCSVGINEKSLSVCVSSTESYAFVDKDKFERVLFHLIDNAIKFNKSNGSITIDLFSINDKAHIIVSDTGVGMDVKNSQLFEKFQQGCVGLDRGFGGIGIGLSFVKSVVDQHDGDIKINSTIGVATVVEITIPLKQKN